MEARICRICGASFIPAKPAQHVCDAVHTRPCPVCGKPVAFKRPSDPIRTCSKECQWELTRQTNIDRRGVPYPMQDADVRKRHETSMLDAHGVSHPLQSSEIKAKAIKSNLERYGTEWALGSPDVHEKIKATMAEKYGAPTTLQSEELRKAVIATVRKKYGCDNVMQTETVKQKVRSTNQRRYGVPNPMQLKPIRDRAVAARIAKHGEYWSDSMRQKAEQKWMQHYGVRNPSLSKAVIDRITKTFQERYGKDREIQIPEFRFKMMESVRIKYGVPYYVLSDEYRAKHSHVRISNINKKIGEMLSDAGHTVEYEFTVGLRSYDLYLPELNTLIEVDPTYTHSQLPSHFSKHPIPIDYHVQKTKLASEAGYRCLHIFDWDDCTKVCDMLTIRTTVYARQCECRVIDRSVAEDFERDNHLQGCCRGQDYCYGLYHSGQLVSVMTFGRPRFNKNYEYELLRLCTLRKYRVVGGAEKMLKQFVSSINPRSIISYCDIAKFTGDVYRRLGFTHVKNTAPNMVWSKGRAKITNNLLLRRGFDQLFNTSYGKSISNNELMLRHGWRPVYDCGQMVFELRFDHV